MLEKKVRPNIKGEMDEFQRLSQDLKRDDNIEVSVAQIVDAFRNANEETLSKDVWSGLENTESNQIKKGDMDAVMDIAHMYNKTNPKTLVKSLEAGDYSRPLILNINGRHILVAGNTRLSTAAAIGMNPKVFIAKIGGEAKSRKIDAKEMTGASSSGSFAPALGAVIKKKDITKIHNMTENELELGEVTSASSSGSYDVPLFGGTKGRKNPLSIGGPDTIYKGRAVKDKNFPKWGGPGGKFVKIKDKCKKFPYCNQGDINALELIESEEMIDAIQYVSAKRGLSTKVVKNMVLKEIKEIFI